MTSCEQYARDVVSGKQVAGQLIIKAAQRFLKDLERTDIYFDEVEADKPIIFAESYLCQWEDVWRDHPIVLEPWQKFIVQQIYGWFVTKTRLRRVKKVYVQVAKKNGKTTLAAIIALYHLMADERIQTPKVFVGANNEDQAKICVNCAGKIVERSPEIAALEDTKVIQLSKYNGDIHKVIHHERDGFIIAMSKEPAKTDTAQSGGKHGINPSAVIIDEFAMADSDSLVNTVQSAMGARQEPLSFTITTSGPKQNGPCFQKLRKKSIEILNNIFEDDTFLAFIYELDSGESPEKDDKIEDESTWIKANPNLGVSVNIDFLRTELKDAKREGGTKEVDVKTFNFNMWVDSPIVWVSSETWNKNSYGISDPELEGVTAYGGLEIIGGNDLNAFCWFYPNVRENIHAVRFFLWMAEARVRENEMKIDCSRWVEQGFIKTCPGNVVDNIDIYGKLVTELEKFPVHSIAFNISLKMHEILQSLVRNGIECNPLSQGFQGQSVPTRAWEELLTGFRIDHLNNPVLAWMNSNTMTNRKDNDIKIQRVGGRTSGIIAAVHALAQYKTVESGPVMDDFTFTSLK